MYSHLLAVLPAHKKLTVIVLAVEDNRETCLDKKAMASCTCLITLLLRSTGSLMRRPDYDREGRHNVQWTPLL